MDILYHAAVNDNIFALFGQLLDLDRLAHQKGQLRRKEHAADILKKRVDEIKLKPVIRDIGEIVVSRNEFCQSGFPTADVARYSYQHIPSPPPFTASRQQSPSGSGRKSTHRGLYF